MSALRTSLIALRFVASRRTHEGDLEHRTPKGLMKATDPCGTTMPVALLTRSVYLNQCGVNTVSDSVAPRLLRCARNDTREI